MRIVSLNAWGGARWQQLAAWLPRCGADVLCLQETTRSELSGWTTFADDVRSLPQRADLFDDVRRVLTDHDASFAASDAGPVTVDGERHRQEFGLGMWVERSLEALERSETFVHGSFTDHDDWPTTARPRVAQAVRLAGPDGQLVLVVHLHGVRLDEGKHDTPERLAQAERLASFVRDLRGPDDLVVVAGDLNLLPDSETFTILRREGLTDLVGESDTRTSLYPKPVRHASYLLVSDPAAVLGFEVLRHPEVSDHRALVLDL